MIAAADNAPGSAGIPAGVAHAREALWQGCRRSQAVHGKEPLNDLPTLRPSSNCPVTIHRANPRGQRRIVFFIRSIALLLILLCPKQLHAQTSPAAFETANKLYYENRFPEAAAAYEKLLASDLATPAL